MYAPRALPLFGPVLLGPGPAALAALVGRPLRGVVCVDLRRDGPAWVVLVAIGRRKESWSWGGC
jgi:hypothetical protein